MKQSNHNLHQKFLNAIRHFNKYIFNHITLTFAGTGFGPFSVVRHIGRHSSRIYHTPVLASYSGETVIIPLSYGENVDWLRNIMAKGGCEIRWQSKWIRVGNPEVLDAESAFSLLPEDRRKLFERFKLEKFLQLRVVMSN